MPVSRRAIARTLSTTASSTAARTGLAVLTLILLAASSKMLFAHDFKSGDLTIEHPWSRATPAGAKVAAGYVTIRNDGAVPDRLVGVSADIAGRSEIHEMAVDAAGIMTMRPLGQGVALSAGAATALKPGGYHIMFLDLKQPAVAGQSFAGTLTFEKAGAVKVEFDVEAMGATPSTHGG